MFGLDGVISGDRLLRAGVEPLLARERNRCCERWDGEETQSDCNGTGEIGKRWHRLFSLLLKFVYVTCWGVLISLE